MKTNLALLFRHSRMLLAGIQAESGLDPRLKHSGVTIWELAPLQPTPFSKEHKDAEFEKRLGDFFSFARDLRAS